MNYLTPSVSQLDRWRSWPVAAALLMTAAPSYSQSTARSGSQSSVEDTRAEQARRSLGARIENQDGTAREDVRALKRLDTRIDNRLRTRIDPLYGTQTNYAAAYTLNVDTGTGSKRRFGQKKRAKENKTTGFEVAPSADQQPADSTPPPKRRSQP